MTPPKNKFSVLFVAMASLFCVCLIVANLMEIKTIEIGPMTLTAGMLVFPLSYIINDCIVEVYGFAKARFVIWLGFILSILSALLLQLAIIMPGGVSWDGQEAMERIYGSVPRIVSASFVAFLCGSLVNAYVMSRLKISMGGKNFSVRAISSTLLGEGIDSLIFFPTAFAGTLPWDVIVSLIISQALLKTAYEIIALPMTLRLVKKLKRVEGVDTYDNNQSYKWWRFLDF